MKNNQIEFKMNEPIKNYSTIKIGGSAKYLAIPSSFGDCLDVFDFVTNKKLDLMHNTLGFPNMDSTRDDK